jgi:hypothetical protein
MSSISEKQYFFGARGTKLVASVVLASSSAFLLLGYDQGLFSGEALLITSLVRVIGDANDQ